MPEQQPPTAENDAPCNCSEPWENSIGHEPHGEYAQTAEYDAHDVWVLWAVVRGYFSEYGTTEEEEACKRVLTSLGVTDIDTNPYSHEPSVIPPDKGDTDG
jgi:hypothetical protein